MTAPGGFPIRPFNAARIQRVGLGVALGLGGLDLWRFLHYQANPDGVSYVDLAREFAVHGPGALVNGYWSPLLPALVGIAYHFVTPTIDTMYAIARVVTFVSFVACALAFHRLLFVLRRRMADGGSGPAAGSAPASSAGDTSAREAALVAVGWAAFVLLVLKGIGVHLITPDMGVAAVAFWVAAEAFSLGDAPWPGRRWALTGVVLALGYWWKAILFPVAVVWLAGASFVALRRGDGLRGPASGWIAFVAVAAVLAIPVSQQVGRPTFGETGRLNYLWYVDAAPYVWERCVAPAGLDASARAFGGVARDSLVSTNPMTCALRTRSPTATLPLWYDPSVYYRTTRIRFDPALQWRALRNNAGYVVTGVSEAAPALLVVFALLALGASAVAVWRPARRQRTAPAPATWILVPLTLAPVAFYVLVYVEFRHVAPFLLLGGVLATLAAARATPRVAWTALVVALVAAGSDLASRVSTQTLIAISLARSTWQGRAPERIPVTQVVARALAHRGLRPGTRVGSIYDAWNPEWAQLAGLGIRAHVPDLTTPLPGVLAALRDECARAAWDTALRRERIAAVVARVPTGLGAPPTFDRLGDTEFFLHHTDAPANCRAAAPPSKLVPSRSLERP